MSGSLEALQPRWRSLCALWQGQQAHDAQGLVHHVVVDRGEPERVAAGEAFSNAPARERLLRTRRDCQHVQCASARMACAVVARVHTC